MMDNYEKNMMTRIKTNLLLFVVIAVILAILYFLGLIEIPGAADQDPVVRDQLHQDILKGKKLEF